jgi:hypothetical protein
LKPSSCTQRRISRNAAIGFEMSTEPTPTRRTLSAEQAALEAR